MRIAAEIGGPVALKIQSPDIPHKSDIGGVHLGARTAAEVEAAARKVFDNARRNCPHAAIDGVLVQEMVEDGVEFILGMTYDETFGPLVVMRRRRRHGRGVQGCRRGAAAALSLTDVADMLASLKVVETARRLSRRAAAGCRGADRLLREVSASSWSRPTARSRRSISTRCSSARAATASGSPMR